MQFDIGITAKLKMTMYLDLDIKTAKPLRNKAIPFQTKILQNDQVIHKDVIAFSLFFP